MADKIGLPREQVCKTLVLKGNGDHVLPASILAGTELDLKALARAAGCKKVEMAPLKEVQPLTGYIRGGVSPVGTKRKYPFYLDESARLHPRISVSAGVRGLQMLLAPGDLLAVTGGKYAVIVMDVDGRDDGGGTARA